MHIEKRRQTHTNYFFNSLIHSLTPPYSSLSFTQHYRIQVRDGRDDVTVTTCDQTLAVD